MSGWEDPLASLRRALERDELQTYCQPILALQSGTKKFPMAEVLVHLREEEESLLPPGDFLPVFDHYRMMTDLDCWVVGKTVKWIAKGAPGSIRINSVNVSSQSLDDSQLVDFASTALADAGVDPGQLCMEIDESDILQRAEAAVKFAQSARALGCKVVIDGFARRSVSFSAIKDLQPDFIKVDGAVIRKVSNSAVARLKLKAIARVCSGAGIGMIAECVEEEHIINHLRQMSVGFAQEFGIALPQPIEIGGIQPARAPAIGE